MGIEKVIKMKKEEISKGWCCELCGCLIAGKCYNDNGYVTHIDSCIIEVIK